jgi:hypothetical protein
MSQRVAGPVRTQRLGVRRRLRAQVLHVLPLRALVPRVQLRRAVTATHLDLRRLDQAHRGIALGLLSSVPDNVDQQVHRRRVALVRISAHAGQKKILGSPLVNLNLPSAN